MVLRVLTGPYDPDRLPIQKVGTPSHHATWILDEEAASLLAMGKFDQQIDKNRFID